MADGGHSFNQPQCPLLTQSGDLVLRIVATQNDDRTPFQGLQIPAVIIDAIGVVLSLEEGDATTRFH
jgi:hypothetical protein